MSHQSTGGNRICTWNRTQKNTVTEIPREAKGIYEKAVYTYYIYYKTFLSANQQFFEYMFVLEKLESG